MLQFEEEQFISIKIKMSKNRDLFFGFDLDVNFTMYVHILNVEIKKILIKNETRHAIKISKRHRLKQISKINCDNCFQIMITNLTIRFSKRKLSKTKAIMFIDTFSIIFTTQLNDIKIRFANDAMIFDNHEIIGV